MSVALLPSSPLRSQYCARNTNVNREIFSTDPWPRSLSLGGFLLTKWSWQCMIFSAGKWTMQRIPPPAFRLRWADRKRDGILLYYSMRTCQTCSDWLYLLKILDGLCLFIYLFIFTKGKSPKCHNKFMVI